MPHVSCKAESWPRMGAGGTETSSKPYSIQANPAILSYSCFPNHLFMSRPTWRMHVSLRVPRPPIQVVIGPVKVSERWL